MWILALGVAITAGLLSSARPADAEEPRIWIVKEGHSVTGIAAQVGVAWKTIADANGLRKPYVIVPGQRLTIPGKATSGSSGGSSDASATAGKRPAPGGTWIVKEGHSVTDIARRVNADWKAIVALNGLQPPYVIVPGQRLTLPKGAAAQPSGEASAGSSDAVSRTSSESSQAKSASTGAAGATHVVAAGETLERIGRRLGVSWRAIADANGIGGPAYVIVIGQKLAVPSSSEAGTGATGGGGADAQAAAPATSGQQTDKGGHRVGAGDTLEQIGDRFGVSWRAIADANGIKGPTFVIRTGQSLTIPKAGSGAGTKTASASAATYVVSQGDTLERIARRYNTSVLALMAANGIKDPNLVRIGSKLRIVGAAPGSTQSAPTSTSGSGSPAASRPSGTSTSVERSLEKWAQHYGLPRDLVKGLAWVESGWQANAVSSAGAVGVMQLMPATAEWLSDHVVDTDIDRYNPDDNIHGGTAYLRWLLTQTKSNERLAIGSYYQGLGATNRSGLYNESEDYVAKVQGARRRFG